MDGEAWRAAVHEVSKSWTWLSDGKTTIFLKISVPGNIWYFFNLFILIGG